MADSDADITFPEFLTGDISETGDAFTFDQQGFHVKIPFPDCVSEPSAFAWFTRMDQFSAEMSAGRSTPLYFL